MADVMRDDEMNIVPEVKTDPVSPGETQTIPDIEAATAKKAEGNEFYKQGEYREAIEKYTEAINFAPQESSFLGNRAAARMMLEEFSLAVDDCLKAIELNPSFLKAYSRAVKCLVQLGKLEQALSLLKKVPADLSNASEIRSEVSRIESLKASLEKATKQVNDGEARLALYSLQTLCKAMSQSSEALLLMCDALNACQKYDDALQICSRVIRAHGSNSNVLRVRGTALYYLGRHEQAIKHFQEAMRFDPDNKQCLTLFKRVKKIERSKQAGNDAFKLGKMKDAYQLYSEALEVDPLNTKFNAVIHCNRAAAAIKLRKYEEAIEDCNQTLEIDESNVKAYLRRGTARLETEDFDNAVRDFEAASKLDPNDRKIRQQVQHAKMELKKSKRKDYYKILGIEKDADERQIKKAYRRQALVHHPDKNSSGTEEEQKQAENRFKDVGEAYSVLSDPEKRRRYDSGVDLDDPMGGFGGQDVDVNQVFQMFFGGGMGGHGHGHGHGHGFHFG